jgi:hypothetical protein
MMKKELIKDALFKLGINFREVSNDEIMARTHLVQLTIYEQGKNFLRLEAQLIQNCPPNKATLSSILNFNKQIIPFAQFYISPQNAVCLGLLLPKAQIEWIDIFIYYLVSLAEIYYQPIANELMPLPFDDRNFGVDAYSRLITELNAPRNFQNQNAYATSVVLWRLLASIVGEKNVILVSETQIAVFYENWTTVSIQPLPYLRRKAGLGDWSIVLQSEAGVIKYLDTRLLIYLNRKNYESAAAAYTLRYVDRKPLVFLQTELTPYLMQYSSYIEWLLYTHKTAVEELTTNLSFPYQIQNLIHYKLNLES